MELIGSLNGLLSGVLAYAGAQLFVEFLAEMRRPRDFIKAMWGAQFFIYSVYLIYGSFVYHYQGQYSFNPAYQGVSTYGWQTAGNMITLIAALISAGLYGNIGIKVLYNNILVDIFSVPLAHYQDWKDHLRSYRSSVVDHRIHHRGSYPGLLRFCQRYLCFHVVEFDIHAPSILRAWLRYPEECYAPRGGV